MDLGGQIAGVPWRNRVKNGCECFQSAAIEWWALCPLANDEKTRAQG